MAIYGIFNYYRYNHYLYQLDGANVWNNGTCSIILFSSYAMYKYIRCILRLSDKHGHINIYLYNYYL